MSISEEIAKYESYRKYTLYSKSMSYCSSVDEALVLYVTALQHEPHVIFECGTAVGWSSMWLAMGANSIEPNVKVFTFDPAQRFKLFDHPKVTRIHGSYRELINTNASQYLGKKKLFFIDGEHKSGPLRLDWQATKPFVEVGDKVIFHDVIAEHGSMLFDVEFQNTEKDYKRDFFRTSNGIAVYTRVQ